MPKPGEVWLARVLPPPAPEFAEGVVFTTPYVMRGYGEREWRAFLKRTLARIQAPDEPSWRCGTESATAGTTSCSHRPKPLPGLWTSSGSTTFAASAPWRSTPRGTQPVLLSEWMRDQFSGAGEPFIEE
jgi:hypothetical protein